MSFATDLRQWRGDRCQKQVNDMFGVKLETYKAWENGVNEPPKLSMKHAQLIMAADCVGVPVELYIEHYWRVIKQVAAEMQAKK